MTSIKEHISTALTVATFTIALTIPTMAIETSDESIWVSSCKGSTLEVGDALIAARTCSNRRYTWQHVPEEGRAAANAG